MKMKIDEIKTNGQVRKDMGDLTELKKSMAAQGLINPVAVDNNGTLLAGHRRLAAAKELGWKQIDAVIIEVGNVQELQLVENLQRKDLTPQEETEAYKAYLKDNKKATPETLAAKIGKTTEYVTRRLKLDKLGKEASEALKKHQIELGHALLLCQLEDSQQKVALKAIKDFDLTVQNIRDQLGFMQGLDFQGMQLRSKGPQKTLFETVGHEIDLKTNTNARLRAENAFKADFAKYVGHQRKLLTDKGITVYNSESELKRKYPHADYVYQNQKNYNQIVNSLPGSKDYVVVLQQGWNGIDKRIWNIKKKEPEKPVKATKEQTKKQQEDAEKMLELNREQKLEKRISEYRTPIQRELNAKLLPANGRVHKALQAYLNFINIARGNSHADALRKEYKLKDYETSFEDFLLITPKDLDSLNHELMKVAILTGRLAPEELEVIGKEHCLDWSKAWKIDQDYLELHSKDQLMDLCKELKISLGPLAEGMKKDELVTTILKEKLAGKTPEAMQGGKRK